MPLPTARSLVRLLAPAALGALLVGAPAAQAAPASTPGQPPGYLVVLRDGADPDAVAGAHGLTVTHSYRHALAGFAGHLSAPERNELAADPRVRFVAEDGLLSLDGQMTPTGVARIDAVRSGKTAGTVNADVAILDTGIDGTHPDLNVVGGFDCTSNNPAAWADDTGHGTEMAGVVGARDNGFGVVGVAPGARLWAVKVGGPKGAKTSDVVCGLDWVAAHAATIHVASLSMSGLGADDGNCGLTKKDALHQAICRAQAAGVTTVVSAGNDGADVAGYVPAAYDEVLTVTAMADYDGRPGGLAAPTCLTTVGADDTAATFSNFAVSSADASHMIAAPGVCILTTAMGGGYATASGTSPAAPHVAGTAARCLASGACQGLSPAQIATKLRADAAAQPARYGFLGDPGHPVTGRYYGWLVYAGGY